MEAQLVASELWGSASGQIRVSAHFLSTNLRPFKTFLIPLKMKNNTITAAKESTNFYGYCHRHLHSKILSVNLTLRECKWTHSGPFALSQSQINTQDFTVYRGGMYPSLHQFGAETREKRRRETEQVCLRHVYSFIHSAPD